MVAKALKLTGSSRLTSLTPRALQTSVRRLLKQLCDTLANYLEDSSIEQVRLAYEVAAQAHHGQRRIRGEKYITHPLEVARLLADVKLDTQGIIAAILHDTIEDTHLTKELIERQFGEEVAFLVEGVSKVDRENFNDPKEEEAENLRRLILASSGDIRVLLIKLADRLHNMKTLESLSEEKQRRKSQETMDLYVPLARLLGVYGWQKELEDLSFQYLFPYRSKVIMRDVKRESGRQEKFVNTQATKMSKLLKENGVEARVYGRVKSVYSTYLKMRKNKCRPSLLQDLLAVRVIVQSRDDCYRALGIIHRVYKPLPEGFSDYIAIPKLNGYQSLHTTVRGPGGQAIEIQIRTEEMERFATTGVVSHLQREIGIADAHDGTAPNTKWLDELIKTIDDGSHPDEFVEHVKLSLRPINVYVFTPQSDIVRLPKDSTALDFAYAIHSELGNEAASAVINTQKEALHTVLQNGDVVQIEKTKKSHAKENWLHFVVTAKARRCIRENLAQWTRKDSLARGQKLLDKALRDLKVSPRRINDEMREALLATLQEKSWETVLLSLGLGRRLPEVVARQLTAPYFPGEDNSDGGRQSSPAIHGTEGLAVSYAECCYPIPNDPIVGTVTRGNLIRIHHEECGNVKRHKFAPDRWNKFSWAKDVNSRFAVPISVNSDDKEGMLSKITTVIAQQGINIRDCRLKGAGDEIVNVEFVIDVADEDHLALVLQLLAKVPSVHNSRRVAKV